MNLSNLEASSTRCMRAGHNQLCKQECIMLSASM